MKRDRDRGRSIVGKELDPTKEGAAAVELEFWKEVGALLPSLPDIR